jgi:hypothetical protein
MKILKPFLFAISLVAIVSCAATRMYEGPSRPSEEVAVITGMNPYDPLIPAGFVGQVLKVDNQQVPGLGTNIGILPGKHELELRCGRPGTQPSTQTVSLDANAGVKYSI